MIFEFYVHSHIYSSTCWLYSYLLNVGIKFYKLARQRAILRFMFITRLQLATYLPSSILYSIRPAFVNTLFPVTRPRHIYSTALIIIILIDNLKYVIIFVYVLFLPWKIPKNASRCPSKQNLRQIYCSDIYYTCLKSLD